MDQVLGNEILPVHAHHRIKGRHNDLFDAVIVAHQPNAVFHRAEQRDGLAGDGSTGVLVKSKRAGDSAQPVGCRSYGPEQCPMSKVNAVKKTKGDHPLLIVWHNLSPKK